MQFDPNQLRVDTNEILAALRRWVSCESPTWDAAAVNRMVDIAAYDLACLGAHVEIISNNRRFGSHLRARFPASIPDAPGILILGHLDTVHPIGTLQRLPWHEAEGRCFGPGILDMKGGCVVALAALAGLIRENIPFRAPVTVLFTSDEEVGSPTSRTLIEAEAQRHEYVLVPEPARKDGGVVTGRYGVSRFSVETRGQPSHAGLRLTDGSSAIREMAHQILSIEAIEDDQTSFSVGIVRGGEWVNCVSESCQAEVLCVSQSNAAMSDAEHYLSALQPKDSNNRVSIRKTATRPYWQTSAGDWKLYQQAKSVAQELGLEIPHQYSGGGSDGNYTGAIGVATLDGLGPCGDGLHTLQEHVIVASLPERTKLLAGIISRIG